MEKGKKKAWKKGMEEGDMEEGYKGEEEGKKSWEKGGGGGME